MYVERLTLRGFRNYDELALELSPRLNVLVGENAQGKTNLLEAIYLLATTKSLRAGRESELIQHGCQEASIRADLVRESVGPSSLELRISQSDKKTVLVNGSRRTRVIDILGELNAVFFGALDMRIVTGDPSVRRRYLDLDIAQVSPRYGYDLAGYRKVLDQRSRLLRDLRDRSIPESGLDAWNEQLVRYGAPLISRRRAFLEELAPLADETHRELSDGRESLSVRYESGVRIGEATTTEEIAAAFHDHLNQVAHDEFRRGTTLVGPQRDDVDLLINGVEARAFGSQGQQRTVVLSLKMAEFRLMDTQVGEPPVMLLDDVMSDLDDDRRARLISVVHRRCQTLLTCTNLRAFSQEVLKDAKVFTVRAGTSMAVGPLVGVGTRQEEYPAHR